MKKSKISLFAFRPEDYREMEAYLQKMADEGWELNWCRGSFAEFKPAGDRKLRYVVDPHAMTSVAYFRNYPKPRKRAMQEEGWFSIATVKGCQILCTADPELPSPVTDEDLKPLVKSTCRLGSLLWILGLLLGVGFLSTKKAVVCAVLLKNLYLVLTLLAAFLLVYHAVNAIVLSTQHSPKNPRVCKRYLVHSAGLICLLLLAVALEMGGRSDMLLLFALPILVVGGGIVLLRAMSGSGDVQKLFPVVIVLSVVLMAMIILINRQMNNTNDSWTAKQQEALLEQAEVLPVLHLSDCGIADEMQNAAKSSCSVLGTNLLYAEQAGESYIFTNYTKMRTPALAKPIFDNLYAQAQKDFDESFTERTADGHTYYVLEKTNACLFREEETVYFFTLPAGADLESCRALLLTQNRSYF